MILELCYFGNPVLRKKCSPISEITDEIKKLAMDMLETMDLGQRGVGIAAPQVGVPIRLFVARSYEDSEDGTFKLLPAKFYINPKITLLGKETLVEKEGCLSIPGIHEKVERPAKILIEYTDLDGNFITEEIEGYNARVRLHENDHINGVLFIDRIDPVRRKLIEPRLKEIKKLFH